MNPESKIIIASAVKKHWWKVILVVFFLAGVYFLANFRFLSVEVIGARSESVKLYSRDHQELPSTTDKQQLVEGLNIVRRGTVIVQATDENRETTTELKLSLVRVNKVSLEIRPTKQVQPLLLESREAECVFQGGAIVYECRDSVIGRQEIESGVVTKTPAFGQVKLIGNQLNCKSGIVTFMKQDGSGSVSLAYITGTNTRVIISDVGKFSGMLSETTNISGCSEPNQSFLVASPDTKKVWYFADTNTSTPVQYSYQNDISSDTANVAFSLAGQNIFINHFTSTSVKKNDPHPEYTSSLIRYEVKGKIVEKTGEFNISKSTKSTDTDGFTAGINNATAASIDITDTLYILNLSNDKNAEVTTKIYNVDDYVINGDSVFYRQGSKVFRYLPDTKVSHLYVNSINTKLGSLSLLNKSLLISGTSDNQITSTNTYVVSENDKTKPDAFDVIPYNLNDLPIASSIYYGNKIYITLSLKSRIYNKETGVSTYDKTEFDLKKEVVLRRLKFDKVGDSRYEVIFKPGY